MHKSIVVASLLAMSASVALAQSAATPASGPAASASAPAKRKIFHAPKLRKGATPATNPELSADKKGGA